MEMETKIEDTELNRALNDAKNLLEGLANLYFTTTSTTKSRLALNGLYQLVKWATLLIAGATTAWLYVEPSLAFGDRFNSKELGIAEVTGNVVCALLVTINISLAFITYLEKTGYAKEKLGKWREKTNRLLETTKNLAIVTGAAVSALPLAAPAWEFSTSYPLWLRVLQVAGIELAYTLVHTFPMMLLVQTNVKYILGAPFYALYFPLYKFPQLLLRSPTTLLAEQT
ncbi:MAG: hypothetical protein JSS53_03650, partial [Proteobacteria bacterium]|nr:hypothetical protein [Pseudomonadota bacterium]